MQTFNLGTQIVCTHNQRNNINFAIEYSLENLPQCFSVHACGKLFASINFTSFVDTLINSALNPSFHQTLTFAL